MGGIWDIILCLTHLARLLNSVHAALLVYLPSGLVAAVEMLSRLFRIDKTVFRLGN